MDDWQSLRRVVAAYRSYEVAAEDKLEAWDCLLLRISSSSVDSEVLPGSARNILLFR